MKDPHYHQLGKNLAIEEDIYQQSDERNMFNCVAVEIIQQNRKNLALEKERNRKESCSELLYCSCRNCKKKWLLTVVLEVTNLCSMDTSILIASNI